MIPQNNPRFRWLAIHGFILAGLVVIFLVSRLPVPDYSATTAPKIGPLKKSGPRQQLKVRPQDLPERNEASTVVLTSEQTEFSSANSQIEVTITPPAILASETKSAAFPAAIPAPGVDFRNYTQKVPGHTFTIDLVAIPGGSITVGSPMNEMGRDSADLPPKEVTINPFWMGRLEISWEQFLPYVFLDRSEEIRNLEAGGSVDKDGISHPSRPYGSVYRNRGENGYPAMGMSQLCAQEYCRWLSVKTGVRYRLPTEAEWEYACRAGATSAYFWGNSPARAKEYSWYNANSGETTHPIGKLKPNPYGLYDIVGNVAEWCGKSATNNPAVARGGAWSEPVSKLRCAARLIETAEWDAMDPKFPLSVWWLSTADFIGFRVVRSYSDSYSYSHASAGIDSLAAGKLFTRNCAGCHGPDGKGNTRLGKSVGVRDYTNPQVKATLDDRRMFQAIMQGVIRNGKIVMHAATGKFTIEQAQSLAAYMRAF